MNNLLKKFTGTTYNEFYEWYRKNKSLLENIPECQQSAEILLIIAIGFDLIKT